VGVGDFDTKAAVVVRSDLAAWQRLNVTAFLVSGIVGGAHEVVVGEPYEDADGVRYLPMLRQPVLVFEAGAEEIQAAHRKALARGLAVAIYINELFTTGRDEDNRAAVRAVPTNKLDLVGLSLRAPHRDADAVLRGLRRHP